jgi:hypothetical protein
MCYWYTGWTFGSKKHLGPHVIYRRGTSHIKAWLLFSLKKQTARCARSATGTGTGHPRRPKLCLAGNQHLQARSLRPAGFEATAQPLSRRLGERGSCLRLARSKPPPLAHRPPCRRAAPFTLRAAALRPPLATLFRCRWGTSQWN